MDRFANFEIKCLDFQIWITTNYEISAKLENFLHNLVV